MSFYCLVHHKNCFSKVQEQSISLYIVQFYKRLFIIGVGLKQILSNVSCFFSSLVTPIYIGSITAVQYKIQTRFIQLTSPFFG